MMTLMIMAMMVGLMPPMTETTMLHEGADAADDGCEGAIYGYGFDGDDGNDGDDDDDDDEDAPILPKTD